MSLYRIKTDLASLARQAFVSLIAVTFQVVMVLVNVFTAKRVGLLRDDRIGHLIGNSDLFLRRQIIEGPKPYHVTFFYAAPCNDFATEILGRQLSLVKNKAVHWMLWLAYPKVSKSKYFVPSEMLTTEYAEFADCPPQLRLTDEEITRGEQELRAMGIEDGAWWVCFHARDSAYLIETKRGRDLNYHAFRDFSISSMKVAMTWVTEQGGYAVRMGAVVSEQVDTSDNPRIIDYSTSNRSDFMDFFLGARCRAFIGNTSGLFHIPKAFGVPYAICNLIGYLHMTPQPKSLFIPKLITSEGRTLDFDECMDLGMFDPVRGAASYRADYYAQNALEPISNSPEEILALTKDILAMAAGEVLDPTTQDVQRDFKDRYFSYSQDRHKAGNLAPSFIQSHRSLIGGDALTHQQQQS